MSACPQLVVVGLDRTTATIDLRERLAFADPELAVALAQLTDPDDRLLEQAAILSTCNRVEVYGVARSRRSREELTSFLARYHGLDRDGLNGAIYVHRDTEVAHHLAATSAGLHSFVLGEAQIQGDSQSRPDGAAASWRATSCAASCGHRSDLSRVLRGSHSWRPGVRLPTDARACRRC